MRSAFGEDKNVEPAKKTDEPSSELPIPIDEDAIENDNFPESENNR